MSRLIICIDFDGVLASHDHGTFDTIGPPIDGAAEFTRRLAEFADLIVYTCRCTEELYKPYKAHLLANEVRAWLDQHGFCYHEIWTGQGKPIAHLYVDDRGFCCAPEKDATAFPRTLAAAARLAQQPGHFSGGPLADRQ